MNGNERFVLIHGFTITIVCAGGGLACVSLDALWFFLSVDIFITYIMLLPNHKVFSGLKLEWEIKKCESIKELVWWTKNLCDFDKKKFAIDRIFHNVWKEFRNNWNIPYIPNITLQQRLDIIITALIIFY